MDQEIRDNLNITHNPGHVSENCVTGFVLETVIVVNSEQNGDLGLSEGFVEGGDRVIDQGMQKERGTCDRMGQVDGGSSAGSDVSAHGFVPETVIVINHQEAASVNRENKEMGVKSNELGSSKAIVDKLKTKPGEEVKNSGVINVKPGSGGGIGFKEEFEGERVCRICHLNSEPSLKANDATTSNAIILDLIQIGCGCKDELGIAHAHCAEAWFKLKGNRICEICGQIAKNVTGVVDDRFMEEWNERRLTGSSGISSDRGRGCWRSQPFCNFLMTCLVIAFILPWFLRVNML